MNQCGDAFFLRHGSPGWNTPAAAARAARHSLLIPACSSLIPSSFLPVTAATISAFFFFLGFHICLRGDFSLFSFILMDSKITVENSQSRDPLPPHRVYPGGSQPMWIGVQVLSSPRNPRRWGMGRPRVSCCSHMEGEVFPPF